MVSLPICGRVCGHVGEPRHGERRDRVAGENLLGLVKDLVGKVAAVRDPDDPNARGATVADPEKWWEAKRT